MSVHVALQPGERPTARVAIVVDVIRATSSIAQALAAGYERVLCCRQIEEALALRATLGNEAVVGGERNGTIVAGFDVGASPLTFAEKPEAPTLILSTTNGTSAILAAAEHSSTVLLGALVNLTAVSEAAAGLGGDIAILCAGYMGGFAFDDVYCAGRIVERLAGPRSDAAIAAERLARAFPDALEGLNVRTYGTPGLERDIAFCARVDALATVPRLTRMVGVAAEIAA